LLPLRRVTPFRSRLALYSGHMGDGLFRRHL
jgi:hypothetical protein